MNPNDEKNINDAPEQIKDTSVDQEVPQTQSNETATSDMSSEESSSSKDSAGVVSDEATTSTYVSHSHEETTHGDDSKKTIYWVVGAVVVALILIAGALYLSDLLPGVMRSGDVVASVNGVDITQDELERQIGPSEQYLAQQTGGSMSDDEIAEVVLEGMINQQLLIGAAENAGVDVSNEEVNTAYEGVVAQFGSEEELNAYLVEVKLTAEGLKQVVREQLLVEAYLATQSNEESIITDEEVRAQYDAIVQTLPEGQEIPAFEDVSASIRDQIEGTQFQTRARDILEQLRADADIEIYI